MLSTKRAVNVLFLLLICAATQAQKPVAVFTANTQAGCAPLLVRFSDNSTNNATQWNWNLGNGTLATIQNPGVTYTLPGNYTVTLIAANANGRDTVVKTAYITVFASPVPDFVSNDTIGCPPLRANFTDKSISQNSTINKWEWSFGDGNIAPVQNPVNTFTTSGNYAVTLKATNTFGCTGSVTKAQYIKLASRPVAAFTAALPASCKTPAKVTFTNTSTGAAALAYHWFFGDGTTSNATNPQHLYATFGTYPVKLVVTNNTGCKDSVTTVVNIPGRQVNLNGPTELCVNNSGTFFLRTSPAANNISWNMGDGTLYSSSTVNHTYTNAGVYNIVTVSNLGDCRDTTTVPITVRDLSGIDFTAEDVTNCKAPFNVKFTYNGLPTDSLVWTFGDGATGSGARPQHTYTQQGSFVVALVATNTAGCIAFKTKDDFIKVRPPVVTFANVPFGGCKPFTFTPSYSYDSTDIITSYQWNFGDGTTASGPSPSHTYRVDGAYNLTLVTTTTGGCTDTLVFTDGIKAGSPTNVDFSVASPLICGSSKVGFTAITNAAVSAYTWNFGDNTLSSDKNPTHNYRDTGFFTVSLSVEKSGCISSIIKTNIVKVQVPVARFSIKKDCSRKRQFTFINTSIDSKSNRWNFGDGTTSTSVSPVHVFAMAGEYKVQLITNNGVCTDTIVKTVPVWTDEIKVSFSRDSLCVGERSVITMEHPNAGAIRQYFWNGEYNAQPRFIPTLVPPIGWDYANPGVFDFVGYTIDTLGCNDTIFKPGAIRVFGPKAYFDVINNTGCTNTPVTFIDTSKVQSDNPVTRWTWNFGDGTTTTFLAPPFTHNYTAPGTYSVRLKITDRFGCSDSLLQQNIVSKAVIKADFNLLDTLTCTNQNIAFTNRSVGLITSTNWFFGDGAGTSVTQPTHSYTDTGNFAVKMVIIGVGGCADSLVKSNAVVVKNPKAGFSIVDSVFNCLPVNVAFTNNSYFANNYLWQFGNGNVAAIANPVHTYDSPGEYLAVLKITSPGGCVDSAQKLIKVTGTRSALNYTAVSGCAPLPFTMQVQNVGTAKYFWDFGNGEIITTDTSFVNYSYTGGGRFVPAVEIVNPSGCTVSISGKDSNAVDVLQLSLSADKTVVCDSGFVQFSDTIVTAAIITNLRWNFGDGSFSDQRNPRHYFKNTGSYNITLSVTTQAGCTKTLQLPNYIQVYATPTLSIGIQRDSCTANKVQFVAVVSDTTSVGNWLWTFDNGNIYGQQFPPLQTFGQNGTYNNYLTIITRYGCKVSAQKEVTVNLPSIINPLSDTTICSGDIIQLRATGVMVTNWQPATGLSCSNCALPLASPRITTQYKITGVYAQNNCPVTDSFVVSVVPPLNLQVNQNLVVCNNLPVQLSASGAHNYLWSPAGVLNASNIANPLATITGNTVFKVVGFDSIGCFNDTATVIVSLGGYPRVNLGADLELPSGTSYTFTPMVSADVVSYNWRPAAGLSCTSCANPQVMVATNATYVLQVYNAAGCTATDTINLKIFCENAGIFIPNTFSPNGDGINDVFFPRGRGNAQISYFVIFNRWGQKVFEQKNTLANNPAYGWNGTINGVKAAGGVYTYFIEMVCENSRLVKYSGNVQLIQ